VQPPIATVPGQLTSSRSNQGGAGEVGSWGPGAGASGGVRCLANTAQLWAFWGQKLSRTTCGARSTGQAPASRGPAPPGAGLAPGAPPLCPGGGYLPRQVPFLRARHLYAQILRARAPISAYTQWKRSGCITAQPNCRDFKKG